MAGLPIEKGQFYTWEDYRTWSDDERWEIIGGEPFDMSPSPTTRHQRISRDLGARMDPFFRKGPCEILQAPMDVKLSDEDVIQPDILIVCDPNQVKRTHIEGPPALVVEILSGSTTYHDRIRKFRLYERSGIREYWIVTPYPSVIEVFTPHEGAYRLHSGFEKGQTLKSPTFTNLEIKLDEVFNFPIDPEEQISVVKESTPPYPARAATR